MDNLIKEKIINNLNTSELIVLDFSAIVNADPNEINELMNLILNSKINVVVSDEFYANYDVINNCSNEEQKKISKIAIDCLNILDQNELLFKMTNVYDSKQIVSLFSNKNNVCFVYYIISEFAETVKAFVNNYKSIIVNLDGDFECIDTATETLNVLNIVIDEDANDDSFYRVDDLPKTGDIVRTKAGEVIQIGQFIAGGGEGDVYECNYKNGYIVKIYKNGRLNNLRIKKMLLMEKKQIRYDGLCWLERVVYSKSGIPVGYIMKRVYGKSLSYTFDSYESVLEMFPSWTKQDLIKLAIEVLNRIQYLHLFGVMIGDLRLNNIMITTDGRPIIVDLDSCQIGALPCPAGFGEFTPAELQKVEFSKQLRTYHNESFSCAILLFKILFCGLHPYDQKNGADTVEEDIAARSFPYPIGKNGNFDRIVFGCYDRIWMYTPRQFQMFLYDIFRDDKRANIQTMIVMLETYYDFIELNKDKNPNINKIAF